MGFIPSEPFPLAEPCAFRLPYPLAVSDIACSCSEDQEVTMPRNFRALLPAKIRTRLEPMRARVDTLMGFSALRVSSFCRERQWPGARLETHMDRVAREGSTHHRIAKPARASRTGDRGRDNRRNIGFHGSDQQPKSVHQDLSPGSPGDSSVLSDCSDFK